MSRRTQFDIGPLTWVKGEIDVSMQRGREAFAKFAAAPDALPPLRNARAQLHMAHGALAIVGLSGVTRVSEALEALLAVLEDVPERRTPEAFAAASDGFEQIPAYLSGLVGGARDEPVKLLPLLRSLCAAAGGPEVDAVDLFHPDLTRRPPDRDFTPTVLHEDDYDRFYRDQRAHFLRGQLRYMRGDMGGVPEMQAAIDAVEQSQTTPTQRAFWWVVLGVLEGIAAGVLPDTLTPKRMLTRVEQQLRRLVEGTASVPERLMREVLYYASCADPSAAQAGQACAVLAAVREVYGLAPHPEPKARERELARALPELTAQLRAVESVLDAYFRDPSRRDGLAELDKPVAALKSGLKVLPDPRAAEAFARCAGDIARLGTPGRTNTQAEFESIAQALSGLGFYLDALVHGEADFDAAMRPIRAERVDPVAVREPAPPAVVVSNVDPELLEIYLEEAEAVLAMMQAPAAALAAGGTGGGPGAADALVEVRRGFHTLKGSGRMVGLNRLGEAAWAVERCLNRLIELGGALPEGLAAMVAFACEHFAGGVAALRAGRPEPDEAELLARIARMEGDDVAPMVAAAANTAAAPAIAIPAGAMPDLTPPPPDVAPAIPLSAVLPDEVAAAEGEPTVEIGTRKVTLSVFTLFSGEARNHASTLQAELDNLATHSIVTDDMMAAAHSLAGVAATVGMETLHALARALEDALQALAVDTVGQAEQEMVAQVVEALADMVDEGSEARMPAPRADLVERLQALSVPAMPDIADADGTAAPAAGGGMPEDRIDPELLPLLLEEAAELLPDIAGALRIWRSDARRAALGRELARLLHTLKGSARMAGAMQLGELTHRMETRVQGALDAGAPDEGLFDSLQSAYDAMHELHEQLAGHGKAEEAAAEDAPASAPEPERAALLRVRADAVDRLVNQAGEVSIVRSRIENEMRALRGAMGELADNVTRLRSQLREIEIQAETQMQARSREVQGASAGFDPLEMDRFTRFQELTRLMAESVGDVQTVQQNLVNAIEETDRALAAQARLSRELQQDLLRVRMVLFASIGERLQRVVRQTADETGRAAVLELRGGATEIDRSVLERITGPLEHLLRNAVSHGIEPADARRAAGKPASGQITLELAQESSEVRLVLSDDGAGLDHARILAKARESGLVPAGATPAEDEVAQLIFHPGFSTAEQVTQVSGRGVGMDVVRSEVGALGGRIELDSESGKGTRFRIFLPLTLAVVQAVLVRAAGRSHAIPAAMVEQVLQMKPDALAEAEAVGRVEWKSRRYPLHALAALLGASAQPDARRATPVLLLRSGSHAIALQVDEMTGSSQEVVLKSIGPQLARIHGVTGATVIGSGEIVLVLNAVALAQRWGGPAGLETTRVVPSRPAAQAAPPAPRLVMIVDDSLTVRKVTSRVLAREGYEVAAARDGVEALEQMQDLVPDALLVDVEMPRMDGFELTRRVRADARLAHLPIIMITSRNADKHLGHAKEAGVDAFLGKPYAEADLVARLAELIKARTRPA